MSFQRQISRHRLARRTSFAYLVAAHDVMPWLTKCVNAGSLQALRKSVLCGRHRFQRQWAHNLRSHSSLCGSAGPLLWQCLWTRPHLQFSQGILTGSLLSLIAPSGARPGAGVGGGVFKNECRSTSGLYPDQAHSLFCDIHASLPRKGYNLVISFWCSFSMLPASYIHYLLPKSSLSQNLRQLWVICQ